MHPIWKTALAVTAAGLALAGCAGDPAPSAPAAAAPTGPAATTPAVVDVVGLVGGTQLVRFTTADPTPGTPVQVSGLDRDTRLVGIDHRVQDGQLYGVGDEGGLYTLAGDGTATSVGRLTVPLEGERFGVDFNPAANALRVISDTGQNLRQPFAATPLPATVADTALTLPATAPATGTVPATGAVAAGYTNNDTDMTTATSLFVLDAAAGRISLQSPANAGTLAPTGSLGVEVGPASGFDVRSDGATNVGYASLQVGDGYELHSIDLLTGRATRIGALTLPVEHIAVTLS